MSLNHNPHIPPYTPPMSEDSNTLCSDCQSHPAELVCFCDFPLPRLCPSACLLKHRAQPRILHFELPLSVASFVTAETYTRQQNWLFGLKRAHHQLEQLGKTVNDLEEETEKAFKIVEESIKSLKLSYKTQIDTLKRDITVMISRAIDETTAQALNPYPELRSPLGEWVWRTADPTNPGDMQMYRAVVSLEDMEERVKTLINVKFEPLNPVLPEIFIGEIVKSTHCKTCNSEFSQSDEKYQCENACQCSICIIQTSISHRNQATCVYCSLLLPELPILKVREDYIKCHVCGLAVSLVANEVETGISCLPCQRCVSITEAPFWPPWSKTTGKCSLCKGEKGVEVDNEIYPLTRSGNRACCSRRGVREEQLECGHLVCRAHAGHLKQCRVCQKPAKRTSLLLH